MDLKEYNEYKKEIEQRIREKKRSLSFLERQTKELEIINEVMKEFKERDPIKYEEFIKFGKQREKAAFGLGLRMFLLGLFLLLLLLAVVFLI